MCAMTGDDYMHCDAVSSEMTACVEKWREKESVRERTSKEVRKGEGEEKGRGRWGVEGVGMGMSLVGEGEREMGS